MATQTRKSKVPPNGVPEKPDPNLSICFVIMPFGGWLDDYYVSVYCPAIKAAGLSPHRADDLFRPSTIVNDIWAYTKRAKVLLADLTGKNPNVFYELGLAHALAKPVILIAESMEDIPFDLRALRIILYDKNAPNWGSILNQKIQNSLNEVITSPEDAVLPAFLDVKAAGVKLAVSSEQKDLIEIKQEMELLRRQLRGRGDFNDDIYPRMYPDEARQMIGILMREGVPHIDVIKRLRGKGIQEDWIRKEMERIQFRSERGISSTPSSIMHSTTNENMMSNQSESLRKQLSDLLESKPATSAKPMLKVEDASVAEKKIGKLDLARKFKIYKDKTGEFRFRLKASNEQIILVSMGYSAKAGCNNGIESVKKNAPDDTRYERKQTQSGKFMFNLKAANHQVIGTSESYETASARNNGIELVKKDAPDARVDDTTA